MFRLIFLAFLSCTFLIACGKTSYRPVVEQDFEDLVASGCGKKDARVSTTALVNKAYEGTIVLWNGQDPTSTFVVDLPKEGFGQKAKGLVGKNKFEMSLETLTELRQTMTPITVSMTCDSRGKLPLADRFSYTKNGARVDFEF